MSSNVLQNSSNEYTHSRLAAWWTFSKKKETTTDAHIISEKQEQNKNW